MKQQVLGATFKHYILFNVTQIFTCSLENPTVFFFFGLTGG